MNQCIFALVRKANRVLFRHYQEALKPTGVSIVQLSVLRTLERNGAMPLSRLAEELAMERTSLYRTIAPMQDSGAVAVVTADKGKAKVAELTTEGQRLIDKVMPYWAKAQESILKEVDSDKWEALRDVLAKVINI